MNSSKHFPALTPQRPLPQALENDLLDKKSLGLVNAYQPALTSTWMFQKSMSVGVGERVNPNLIVDLLANNFKSMDKVGGGLRTVGLCWGGRRAHAQEALLVDTLLLLA